jgi:poly(A) polymerase
VDYVGGLKDIREKVIRPIIPLGRIFMEDPVRMVRAVKYACKTGFPMPLRLRRRIKKDAPLLETVSASRLTEEITKILHSAEAGEIINTLEDLGLNRFMQPLVSAKFRESKEWKEKYLSGFSGIADDAPLATLLAAMVRQVLEENVDFATFTKEGPAKGAAPMSYKDAFMIARKFVLPMNPPRVELDKAVKQVFAEQGVVVKRSALRERSRKSRSAAEKPQNQNTPATPDVNPAAAATNAAQSPAPNASKPKSKRRRRPRKSGKPGKAPSGA